LTPTVKCIAGFNENVVEKIC